MRQVPQIWLVLGDKLGDNAQVEIIAESLDLPFQRKTLQFKERYRQGKPWLKAALYHVDLAASEPLEPPWPDMVLTIGRRPSMAALWIRRQSGGKTKLVLIGRPRRYIQEYDLIVMPPQFLIPEQDKVLPLSLPLMRADPRKVEAEAERWKSRFESFPRPLTAVLVGGPTRPFRLDSAVATDLVAKASEAFGSEGTLFFSTSRRTPAETTEALAANLPAGAQLFRWQPDQSENPYLALLGLADRCVVTGDSISMMVESVRAGKPLSIFALPMTGSIYARFLQFLQKQQNSKVVAAIARLLYGLGLVGFGRDLTALHQSLFRQGFATPLGSGLPAGAAPQGRVPDDLEPVVTRIKELLYKSEDYRTQQHSKGS